MNGIVAPTEVVCTLWVDGHPVEYHFFSLPAFGEPDFYQATTSFNGFRNTQSKRHYDWVHSKRRKPGDVYPRRGHAGRVDEMFSYFVCLLLPRFKHKTIWDMYHAIGYDHKHKRFITITE